MWNNSYIYNPPRLNKKLVKANKGGVGKSIYNPPRLNKKQEWKYFYIIKKYDLQSSKVK